MARRTAQNSARSKAAWEAKKAKERAASQGEPPVDQAEGRALMFSRGKFIWHGLALHLGRRKTPLLTLVADPTYPHLYRIRYPDGWLSDPANLTRA